MDYQSAFNSVMRELRITMRKELVESCKASFDSKIQETVEKTNAIVENAPKPNGKRVYQDIFITIKKMSCDFGNDGFIDKIISKHFQSIDNNICQLYTMLGESHKKVEDFIYANNMKQVQIDQLKTENTKLKEEVELYKKKYLDETSKFRINADKLKKLIDENKRKQ